MYLVTIPSGRRYTFASRNYGRAVSLADRTGGTLISLAASGCGCSVPGCNGCDDLADRARDDARTGPNPWAGR